MNHRTKSTIWVATDGGRRREVFQAPVEFTERRIYPEGRPEWAHCASRLDMAALDRRVNVGGSYRLTYIGTSRETVMRWLLMDLTERVGMAERDLLAAEERLRWAKKLETSEGEPNA